MDDSAYIPDLRRDLLLAVLVGVVMVVLGAVYGTRGWDDWLADRFAQVRYRTAGPLRTPETSGIVVIEIDRETERALEATYGRYPYPPEAYAALLERLAPHLVPPVRDAQDTRTLQRIAFAMPLDARAMAGTRGGARLAAALQVARLRTADPQGVWAPCGGDPDRASRGTGAPPRAWAWDGAEMPPVPAPREVREGSVAWRPPLPLVREALPFGGVWLPAPEADGVYRRLPTGVRVGGVPYPEYSFALRHALDLPAPGGGPAGLRITATFLAPPDAQDDEGLLTINYAGPTRAVFTRLSMGDVLTMPDERLAEHLRGARTALVGPTLPGITPTTPSPFDREQYPVHLLAHALLMHETKAYLTPVSPRAGWVLAALVALSLGLGLHAVRAGRGALLTLGVVVALLGTGYGLFLGGHRIPVALPLLTAAATYLVLGTQRLAREERRRRSLQRHFTEYLSVDLVMRMMEGADLKLDGEVRTVVVMFADLRGFTAWSATRDPLEVINQLNEFLGEMSRIVEDHGGTVDKFIGDEIMAVFGAPAALENPARTAVMAALEMQERLADLSRLWAMEGRHPFTMGIAIHTGEAVVGEIGTEVRRSYTAIGSTVNLTKRLEEKTKEFDVGIICTHATMDMAGDLFTYRELGATTVRGIDRPVLVYEVVGRRGPTRL